MKFLLIFTLLIGGVFTCRAQDLTATPDASTGLDGVIDLGAGEPLYLVSSMQTAKIVTKDQFEQIDQDQVDYIQVIKDPSSIVIYGDKARNGVVLIVMKGNSFSDVKGNSFSEKYSSKRRRNR